MRGIAAIDEQEVCVDLGAPQRQLEDDAASPSADDGSATVEWLETERAQCRDFQIVLPNRGALEDYHGEGRPC